MGSQAIAIGGKYASTYQRSDILRSPVKRVVILLDEDAYPEALDLGLKLCYHKKVKVVRMPKDKDVNDLGKKETIKLIKATPYMNHSQLIKLSLETT